MNIFYFILLIFTNSDIFFFSINYLRAHIFENFILYFIVKNQYF